jgi:hypothetical protein
MFQSSKLRKVVLCLGLEVGALMGANIRAEEIEDLLWMGQRVKIEYSIPADRDEPDDPLLRSLNTISSED